MKRNRRMPERSNSSMTYSTTGLRPRGSISLGWLFVKGHSRVPRPATGMTATILLISHLHPPLRSLSWSLGTRGTHNDRQGQSILDRPSWPDQHLRNDTVEKPVCVIGGAGAISPALEGFRPSRVIRKRSSIQEIRQRRTSP